MHILVWVIIYLLIDISYIVLTSKTNLGYIKTIAGKLPKNKVKFLVSFVLAYTILAIGWVFICLKLTTVYKLSNNRFFNGFLVGALYGVVVYGLFDFTISSMFDDWGWKAITQDILWGTLYTGIITGVYTLLKY